MVDLFVCTFSSHSRIFHSFGDFTISGEGLQILIYARLLWPLISEGSLARHIYKRAFGSGAVTTCLNDVGLSRLGFEDPILLAGGANALTHSATAAAIMVEASNTN